MRELLTNHFYRDEFGCKGKKCCGHSAPIDLFFVELLEFFRVLLGNKQLIVNSGFRCQTYNDTIPTSSPTSQHIKGTAADIRIPNGMDSETVFTIAKESKMFGGI